MTNILNFKPRARRAAFYQKQKHPAQIIIFPGIRYERIEGANILLSRREVAARLPTTNPVVLQG